jgi:hypothetical protein
MCEEMPARSTLLGLTLTGPCPVSLAAIQLSPQIPTSCDGDPSHQRH